MSNNVPTNLQYTKTHEWVRVDSDDVVTIGITDHAQSSLGDMVFVELPEVGSTIDSGSECGVIESVKSASDLYAPLGGEVIAVNSEVIDTPSLLNTDPQGAGWLMQVRLNDKSQLANLLDSDAYSAILEECDH